MNEVLRSPEGDFQFHADVGGLAKAADVVFTAALTNPRAGRTISASNARDAVGFETVIFDTEGEQMLAGSRRGLLAQKHVVELQVPSGRSASDVAAELPKRVNAIVFASEYAPRAPTTAKNGVEGVTYLFPLRQGFVYEEPGGGAAAVGEPLPKMEAGRPFAEILAQVRNQLTE